MPPRNAPIPQIVRRCSVSFVPRCGVPWGASWPGVFTGRKTTNVPRFVRGCCRVQGIWVCWHVRWLGSWDFHPDGLAAPSGKQKLRRRRSETCGGMTWPESLEMVILKPFDCLNYVPANYIYIYYNRLGEMGRCSNLTYTALLCLTGRKKKQFFAAIFGWDLMESRYPKNALPNLDGKNDSQNSFQILCVFQPEHLTSANLLPNLS